MKLIVDAGINVIFPESSDSEDFTEVSFTIGDQIFAANLFDVIKEAVVINGCKDQAVLALREMAEKIDSSNGV